MKTTILEIGLDTLHKLEPAAQALKRGGLVAFPTETVYGLGAIYQDPNAILNIYAVKGRPADNPLIVHIWHQQQLLELASEVSLKSQRLIDAFWPGPLTIIFPKQPHIPPVVTANLDTIAVRMPAHPVAQELLRLTGIPVAAPSANLSGKPSTTKGSHVIADLNGKIEYIIDSGSCENGIESTVLSVAGARPIILRPGSVTKEMLEEVLDEPVELAGTGEVDRPMAPGMKYRHYAPKAPVTLVEGPSAQIVLEINRLLEQNSAPKIAVISSTENMGCYKNEWVLDLGPKDQPQVAAARLFDLLRFCDQLEVDQIYIEGIPMQGVGVAVSNRLRKAAGGNVINVS